MRGSYKTANQVLVLVEDEQKERETRSRSCRSRPMNVNEWNVNVCKKIDWDKIILYKENSKAADLGNLAGAGATFQSAEPDPFSGSGALEPCRSPSLGAMTPEPFSKFFTAKICAGAFVHAHVITR